MSYALHFGTKHGPCPKKNRYSSYFRYVAEVFSASPASEGQITPRESRSLRNSSESLNLGLRTAAQKETLILSCIFLERFTGIRNSLDKLVSAWADEINPTFDEKQNKLEDLRTAQRLWDDQSERDRKRREAREKRKKDLEAEGIEPATKKRKVVQYPTSRKAIEDMVHSINTSGVAYVPLVIFPEELSPEPSQQQLRKFAGYFDKRPERSEFFLQLQRVFESYL